MASSVRCCTYHVSDGCDKAGVDNRKQIDVMVLVRRGEAKQSVRFLLDPSSVHTVADLTLGFLMEASEEIRSYINVFDQSD